MDQFAGNLKVVVMLAAATRSNSSAFTEAIFTAFEVILANCNLFEGSAMVTDPNFYTDPKTQNFLTTTNEILINLAHFFDPENPPSDFLAFLSSGKFFQLTLDFVSEMGTLLAGYTSVAPVP